MPNYKFIQTALLGASSLLLNAGIATAKRPHYPQEESNLAALKAYSLLVGTSSLVLALLLLQTPQRVELDNRKEKKYDIKPVTDKATPKPETKKQLRKRLANEFEKLERAETAILLREGMWKIKQLDRRNREKAQNHERKMALANELKELLATKPSSVIPETDEARAKKDAKLQAWIEEEQYKADKKYRRTP